MSVAEMSNKGLVPPGMNDELGMSPATLHLPLVRMESMESPSAPKYSSAAQSIEVGFDPKVGNKNISAEQL